MKIIESEQLLVVDIDGTLLVWPSAEQLKDLSIRNFVNFKDPYDGTTRKCFAHGPNIKILKDRKLRGATTLVWSASGYKWAVAAIEALGLQESVDYVASKPFMALDDLPAAEYMPPSTWLKPESNWGR